MKILVFTHEYPPEVGGAGIVAQQLVSVLSKNGHDVDLLTRKKNKQRIEGVNVFAILMSLSLKGFWFFTSFIRLLIFDFNKYDRIIINDFPSSAVASFLFSKKTLQKSIFMWHGSEDKTLLNENNINGRIFSNKYLKALDVCHRILAVSEFQKYKLINIIDNKLIKDKVKVQYAGVDSNLFYPLKINDIMNFKMNRGFLADDIILLSVGRINALKGYKEMYRIFSRLPNKFHWIIIGDGELCQWLKKQSKTTNIHLLGRLNRDELNMYYNLADLFFLYTSPLLQEAFGLVYIEAALTGTPVLARKKIADGTNESVKDIGWLIQNEEDVITFFENKEFINVDKKIIRENAEEYSIQRLIKSIEQNICL